jgi:hypothetical protein
MIEGGEESVQKLTHPWKVSLFSTNMPRICNLKRTMCSTNSFGKTEYLPAEE